MATAVEDLRERGRVATRAIQEHVAKFGDDNVPDADAETHLEALVNAQADIRAQLTRAEKFDSARAGAAASQDGPPAVVAGRPDAGASRQVASLGSRFVTNPAFTEALARYAPSGQIPVNGGFQMPGMAFGGLNDMMAALVTGSDPTGSGGAFIIPDRQPGFVTLGRRPLHMREIVRNLQTSGDLVEYVAQLSRTNSAASVAEATAAGDGTGVKPESGMNFQVRQAPVKTIANWMPITKQAVADVPQMRGLIDTELRDNLDYELDNQIVNGAGGTQITGILNTSGRQTQAFVTNILTTTRKAKTIASTVGRVVPNAYVLNPSDSEAIELLQDNEARYYFGGPGTVMIPRLWGLPIVESEAVPALTGLTGDFNKCVLWDREQASLAISDSHSDFFIRNLLALLAELRAAFAVVQPSAMIQITLA